MATNANKHGQYTSQDEGDLPPEPPPFPRHPAHPPPSPTHPKRLDDDNNNTKLNKTPARLRADALHNPGGETDASGSIPPSVRLEGEKIRPSSLYVKAIHVETDDNDVQDDHNDHDTQQSPRRPVGTPDSDEHRPNGPTEPPDEKDGEREVDSELGDKSKVEMRVEMVERVETKELSRVGQPGGRGVEETKSREVKDELGGTDKDDSCQRDGRTCDTGDAMSSTSCDSGRVEAGLLAEDEEGQQRNDM
ncbi:hypothetical protein BDN67DRAFT_1013711 [Paxillus ammoniavirescens]|nr:hypothetical protein BDN67DRAFT_1013711 [Paxillus ammoniavirescens]